MPTKHAEDSQKLVRFSNCDLLRDHQIIRDDLWIRGGKILNPEKVFFDEQVIADVVVDCKGMLIVPGFIDVQINGGFGVDFSVDTSNFLEGLHKVSKGLLEHGVTSFCPTVVTNKPELYRKILPQIKKTSGGINGAGILGVHLEGPFINKEKKGAHDEDLITGLTSGISGMRQMYGSLENAAILTLAPELPGALDVISDLTTLGITVSLGHSMASLTEGEMAVKAGARFITHLFNAMLPFHHRDPHLVGLLASHKLPPDTTIFYGMISDGIHTHPAALRIAQRTHPKGIVLVTDAVSAMGLPSGVHRLGSQMIEIRANKAVLLGSDTLCGSIATMNECVKYFFEYAECSLVDALEAATLHPAQLLDITAHKGTLDFDTDADFLLLDSELNVAATYIGGNVVWMKAD